MSDVGVRAVRANQGSPGLAGEPWHAVLRDTSGNAIGSTLVSGAYALKVDIVQTVGGAGGGTAQLAVLNSGDTAWVNIGVGAEGAAVLHVPVRIQGTGSDVVEPLSASPAAGAFALPVRQVGTLPVSVPNTGTGVPAAGAVGLTVRPLALLPSNTGAPAYAHIALSGGSTAWNLVVAANANRRAAAIRNKSTQRVYLAWGDPGSAVTESAIALDPGYAWVEDLFSGAIYNKGAGAASAASGLVVQENSW